MNGERREDAGPGEIACRPEDGCSLCGDVAVRARIDAIDASGGSARATVDGGVIDVALDLVENVVVGDTVLVHQGFAIGRVTA